MGTVHNKRHQLPCFCFVIVVLFSKCTGISYSIGLLMFLCSYQLTFRMDVMILQLVRMSHIVQCYIHVMKTFRFVGLFYKNIEYNGRISLK